MVDGVRAGQTMSAGGLTYATVDEAGHMVSSAFGDVRRTVVEDRQVPYDRPVQALVMLNRWLAGEDL